MKKILLTVLFFPLSYLFSQCLTDQIHKDAIKQNPQIAADQVQFYNSLKPVSNTKRATKYIIPVVFHVIHTNGAENISKAQIEDQIRVLNLDYSLNNINKASIRSAFKSLAADCEIEFRLAKIDPSGKCTDGINRIYSPLHVEAGDAVKSIAGARWDNKKYLNIWTVSTIASGSGTGTTLGYAYLPSSVAGGFALQDGIVCRADCVGALAGFDPFGKVGRVLTHEIGHYLGLLHTFQDGCSGTGNNAGDYCDDTPPVAGTFTNASCPANNNSCTSEVPDLVDQWENYMDYSEGTCQSMFTAKQKVIMHNVITGYSFRTNLVSDANLRATGVETSSSAPIAFFSSDKRSACVGEPVTFFDNSCKALVDSRQWQFTGANTFTTNLESPTITYNTPGKYKVTLIATNSSGSNTLAADNYIEIRPAVSPNKPAVVQGFEADDWLTSSDWKILDPGAAKFNVNKFIAYSGSRSIKAPCDSSIVVSGQRFQLTTPSVDLRPLIGKSPKLSMMVAYAMKDATAATDPTSAEKLRFFVSRGCNGNWEQILVRNAAQFAYSTSSASYTTKFKPTSTAQWKLVTFNLSAYTNDSNVQFMIEVESQKDNSVYIDDINISQYNSSISVTEKTINLNVFPNPASDKLTINYENNEGETEVWLENIEGKKIEQISESNAQSGNITIEWSNNLSMSSGVYILKIKANNQVISKKIIFAN